MTNPFRRLIQHIVRISEKHNASIVLCLFVLILWNIFFIQPCKDLNEFRLNLFDILYFFIICKLCYHVTPTSPSKSTIPSCLCFHQVSGDDRVFSSAVAASTLIFSWTTQDKDGSLKFDKGQVTLRGHSQLHFTENIELISLSPFLSLYFFISLCFGRVYMCVYDWFLIYGPDAYTYVFLIEL